MENKLSTEQKLTAASLILMIAASGAAISFAYYKGNYFVATAFTAMLYTWYRSLIHMLTWAATSKKSLEYNVLTKQEVEEGRSSAYNYLA